MALISLCQENSIAVKGNLPSGLFPYVSRAGNWAGNRVVNCSERERESAHVFYRANGHSCGSKDSLLSIYYLKNYPINEY